MSLNDRQHVEAVAIIERLITPFPDPIVVEGAKQWLKENHPEPAAYMAAMTALSNDGEPTS